MKKILSTLAAFVLLLGLSTTLSTTANAYGSVYENITKEVLQIQSYMDNKMYIEAIRLCENTKYYRKLSYADKALMDQYIQNAKSAYSAYLDNEKRTKTTQHYIADWCLGYKFFEAYSPQYDYGNWVEVYSANDHNDVIYIYSYRVNEFSDLIYNTVRSPQQLVSAYARSYKDSYYGSEYSHLVILSENDTNVGDLPARQVTFRTSTDLNRYGTQKDYWIERCTAFQLGDWVYAIVAWRNDYSWGDDFWNKMELIRNSISFY